MRPRRNGNCVSDYLKLMHWNVWIKSTFHLPYSSATISKFNLVNSTNIQVKDIFVTSTSDAIYNDIVMTLKSRRQLLNIWRAKENLFCFSYLLLWLEIRLQEFEK